MKRAGKYGKKINKNMMLKRKKNYRIIKMLKKLDKDYQHQTKQVFYKILKYAA